MRSVIAAQSTDEQVRLDQIDTGDVVRALTRAGGSAKSARHAKMMCGGEQQRVIFIQKRRSLFSITVSTNMAARAQPAACHLYCTHHDGRRPPSCHKSTNLSNGRRQSVTQSCKKTRKEINVKWMAQVIRFVTRCVFRKWVAFALCISS